MRTNLSLDLAEGERNGDEEGAGASAAVPGLRTGATSADANTGRVTNPIGFEGRAPISAAQSAHMRLHKAADSKVFATPSPARSLYSERPFDSGTIVTPEERGFWRDPDAAGGTPDWHSVNHSGHTTVSTLKRAKSASAVMKRWSWARPPKWFRLKFDSPDAEVHFQKRWRRAFSGRSMVAVVLAAMVVLVDSIVLFTSANDTEETDAATETTVGVVGIVIVLLVLGSCVWERVMRGAAKDYWTRQRTASLTVMLIYEVIRSSNLQMKSDGEGGFAYLHPTALVVLAAGLWLGLPRVHVGMLGLIRVVWDLVLYAAGDVTVSLLLRGLALHLGVTVLAVQGTNELERTRRTDFLQQRVLESEVRGLRNALGKAALTPLQAAALGNGRGGGGAAAGAGGGSGARSVGGRPSLSGAGASGRTLHRGSTTGGDEGGSGAGLARALNVLKIIRNYVPADVAKGIDKCAQSLLKLNDSSLQDFDSYIDMLETSGPLHHGEGWDWLASAGFSAGDVRETLTARYAQRSASPMDELGHMGNSFLGEGTVPRPPPLAHERSAPAGLLSTSSAMSMSGDSPAAAAAARPLSASRAVSVREERSRQERRRSMDAKAARRRIQKTSTLGDEARFASAGDVLHLLRSTGVNPAVGLPAAASASARAGAGAHGATGALEDDDDDHHDAVVLSSAHDHDLHLSGPAAADSVATASAAAEIAAAAATAPVTSDTEEDEASFDDMAGDGGGAAAPAADGDAVSALGVSRSPAHTRSSYGRFGSRHGGPASASMRSTLSMLPMPPPMRTSQSMRADDDDAPGADSADNLFASLPGCKLVPAAAYGDESRGGSSTRSVVAGGGSGGGGAASGDGASGAGGGAAAGSTRSVASAASRRHFMELVSPADRFDDIGNDEVADIVERVFNEKTYSTFALDTVALEKVCESPLLVVAMAVLDSPHAGAPALTTGGSAVWSRLNVDRDKAINFLREIDAGYLRRNPYHTATHASNVVWHSNFLVQRCGLKPFLKLDEWFAVIIAAAVHDFAHPGLTNAYLVAANASIALQHNDQSVLERYHLAGAFKVSRRRHCQVFDDMPKADFTHIRKHIIDVVLATDVSNHFSFISHLKQASSRRVPGNGSSSDGTNAASLAETERMECSVPPIDLLRAVVTVADLAHAALPWQMHLRWSQRIQEEFFRQGDLERAKGVEVSRLCDRSTMKAVPKNQVGFFQFLVMPLFKAVDAALPLEHFGSTVMRPAKANMKRWEEIAAIVEAETSGGEHTATTGSAPPPTKSPSTASVASPGATAPVEADTFAGEPVDDASRASDGQGARSPAPGGSSHAESTPVAADDVSVDIGK